MDEHLEASKSSEPKTGVATTISAANAEISDSPEQSENLKSCRTLNVNELQEASDKRLKTLAHELGLHLHPVRSRHQHIVDLVRAALSAGATVTAEGFLDQISDSFAMLRWPRLNFLPVPEDVCVPRMLIEQHGVRPGQKITGTLRLPAQREKFVTLERVTHVVDRP